MTRFLCREMRKEDACENKNDGASLTLPPPIYNFAFLYSPPLSEIPLLTYLLAKTRVLQFHVQHPLAMSYIP